MRRLSSVVPLLSLFLLVPLGEASGQTLPSLPKLQEGQSWGGFIRGGMTLASGEMDARSIDAASAVVFGRPELNGNMRMFMVLSRATKGSSSPELKSERYAVEGDLQRSLRGPLYLVANADWERDETQGIAHRASAGLGLGVTAFQDERSKLDIEGAGGYVREDLTQAATDRFTSFAALTRGHLAPNERVSLDTEIEWVANLEDSGDHLVHADASLTTQLWGPLQLSLSYLLTHDTEPAPVDDPFDPQPSPSPADGTQGVLTVQLGVSF